MTDSTFTKEHTDIGPDGTPCRVQYATQGILCAHVISPPVMATTIRRALTALRDDTVSSERVNDLLAMPDATLIDAAASTQSWDRHLTSLARNIVEGVVRLPN